MENVIDYSSKKALLVEDNIMNVKLFSLLLRRIGIQFDIATDGEEAIALFDNNYYDIVLTDINLPKLLGNEMAKIMRKNTDSIKAKTPIIALTASILTSEINSYLEIGINEVLLKPFSEERFKQMLKNYVK
jgi:CheY-like chemotaxis protein